MFPRDFYPPYVIFYTADTQFYRRRSTTRQSPSIPMLGGVTTDAEYTARSSDTDSQWEIISRGLEMARRTDGERITPRSQTARRSSASLVS